MEDHENIYDKIKEILGSASGTLNIMESEIDVGLQMEYFEFSRKIASERDESWAIEQTPFLEDPEASTELKKELLARLASVEQIAAYRTIEKFYSNAEPDLKEWSMLALHESRMHLESHFLDENQVFISTGLGGKGDKLRYFVVLITRMNNSFTPLQQRIVQKEFSYFVEKTGGEVEEFDTSGYLATLQVLVPLDCSIKNLFDKGIEECNQYGDFLRDTCIITNVKKLTFDEIEDFIERKTRSMEENNPPDV